MILSILLIARIASRPIQLRRCCAPTREPTGLRRPTQTLALLIHDDDLAAALTPTASDTPYVPANARWPRLVA